MCHQVYPLEELTIIQSHWLKVQKPVEPDTLYEVIRSHLQ